MITSETSRTVLTGNIKETVEYHFDPKNTVHIAQILRSMYSDPAMAVVREYCANAVDAHAQAGIPDKPIEVWAPTVTDSTFRVRDYGPGLSKEDTKALLYGYGASGEHKRSSNSQIGGFGIGCKSGFAVASQFTYTVFHGGVKRVWNCYLDDHDMSQAALVAEEESKEPSGVLTEIPVKQDYRSAFLGALTKAFTFYPVKPKLTGLDTPIAPEPKYVNSGHFITINKHTHEPETITWKLMENPNENPTIVMGGIAYPVKLEQLQDGTNTVPLETRVIRSVALFTPIGFVQLSPNREELQYSTRTKQALLSVYTKLSSRAFFDELTKGLQQNTTMKLGDKITMSQKFVDLLGGAEHVDKIMLPMRITRNGFIWDSRWEEKGKFEMGHYDATHVESYAQYTYQLSSNFYEIETANTDTAKTTLTSLKNNPTKYLIPIRAAHTHTVVVLGVPFGTAKGTIRDRVKQITAKQFGDPRKIPTQNKIYNNYLADMKLTVLVIQSTDKATFEAGIAKVPWLADKSVSAVFESEYANDAFDASWFTSPSRHGRRGNSGTRTSYARNTYAAHGKKFVQYKGGSALNAYSELWEPFPAAKFNKAVKEKEELIYVKINKYIVQWAASGARATTGSIPVSMGHFADVVARCTDATGLPATSILGVRSAHEADVSKIPGVINLQDYIAREYLAAVAKNADLEDAVFWGLTKYRIDDRWDKTTTNQLYEFLKTTLPNFKGTKTFKIAEPFLKLEELSPATKAAANKWVALFVSIGEMLYRKDNEVLGAIYKSAGKVPTSQKLSDMISSGYVFGSLSSAHYTDKSGITNKSNLSKMHPFIRMLVEMYLISPISALCVGILILDTAGFAVSVYDNPKLTKELVKAALTVNALVAMIK